MIEIYKELAQARNEITKSKSKTKSKIMDG
ncbi:hypothetical protein ACJIZ3_010663 [Penstemon smallii]|uniref:Uncharacterized protein n=1 Tax=Penstemon smallii TaxID=265156 RepID=A0ABD3UGY1_9LAMI